MSKYNKGPITRSENMARIKSKNTDIELILRKALWAKGFRYRVNDTSVIGKPDIVFKRKKVAIFCDSEFWHGKPCHGFCYVCCLALLGFELQY